MTFLLQRNQYNNNNKEAKIRFLIERLTSYFTEHFQWIRLLFVFSILAYYFHSVTTLNILLLLYSSYQSYRQLYVFH